MNPIPVGLIGVGRHGSRYLHHLLTEETGGTLLAFSRHNQVEGQRLAQQYHLRFYPNWRDLLADSSIQAVIVVTPPALNLPIAQEAIQSGKAILMEKPLALNPVQAQDMIQSAKHAQLPFMTAQTLRYEPAIQTLQELGPSLGNWQYLSLTMRFEIRPEQPDNREGWDHYGVLMEFGIHLLDLVRFLTGDEIVSVSTDMKRPTNQDPECRVWGTLTTSHGLSCFLDISRVSQGRITRAEIIGTQGQACADWTNHEVTLIREGGVVTDYHCPKFPTLLPLLRDFFSALQTDRPPPITGVDGLQAVRIADACYRSAETGSPAKVN